MVFDVLVEIGYVEMVYRMLIKIILFLWGYWIKEIGVIFLYEIWDVICCIGDVFLNYFLMGVVSVWMYKYLVGICFLLDVLVFKKILIQLCFLFDFDFVEVSYELMYGIIWVDWRWEEGKIWLYLVLFLMVMVIVVLFGQKLKVVKGGEYIFVIFEQ